MSHGGHGGFGHGEEHKVLLVLSTAPTRTLVIFVFSVAQFFVAQSSVFSVAS